MCCLVPSLCGAPAEFVLGGGGGVAPEACLWQALAILEYTGVCIWAEVGVPLTLWNSASSSKKWSSQPLLPRLLCGWKGRLRGGAWDAAAAPGLLFLTQTCWASPILGGTEAPGV